MTDSKAKPIAITLSAATKAFLTEKAAAGFRSLNKEIAMRIEESCARDMAAASNQQQKGRQS